MKNISVIFLGFILSLNAWGAPDPSKPGLAFGAVIQSNQVTSVRVGVIKTGSEYLYFSDSSILNGGVFGYYNKSDLDKSWMVASLPIFTFASWNHSISTGIYLLNVADVLTLTKPNMVINSLYPFAWNIDTNAIYNNGQGVLYNRVHFVPARTPNLLGNTEYVNNPRGLQVQASELPVLGDLLKSYTPFTVVSIDTYQRADANSVAAMESSQMTNAISRGVMISRVNLIPYDAGSLSFSEVGEVAISPSGKILSVPAACTITTAPAGMLCPLDLSGIKAAVKYTSNNAGVLFKSGPSDAGTTTLTANTMTNVFYSADWILDKMRTQDTIVLENYQSLSLSSNVVSAINVPFDQFSKLTIKKLSYAVTIQERTAGAVYSGVVGQSAMTIPYLVTQSGDSKATSVTVKVSNDSRPAGLKDNSCAFHTDLNNASKNQVIAVPVRLDFYNPMASSFKQTRLPGCNGGPVQIGGVDMPWFDTYDISSMYQNGQLALDMVFDLTDSAIQSDINGQYWQGTATGTGQISVEATWN